MNIAESEVLAALSPTVRRKAGYWAYRTRSIYLVDDLHQDGMIALLLKCRNYDAGRGASLWQFAHRRVTGAILDSLRREKRISDHGSAVPSFVGLKGALDAENQRARISRH